MTSSIIPAVTKTFDVVGIGNAIVDVLVQADEAFLESHGLTKGTMALIDEAQAERLYASVGVAWKPPVVRRPTPWRAWPSWGGEPVSSAASVTINLVRSSPMTSERWGPASTPRPPALDPPRPVA